MIDTPTGQYLVKPVTCRPWTEKLSLRGITIHGITGKAGRTPPGVWIQVRLPGKPGLCREHATAAGH